MKTKKYKLKFKRSGIIKIGNWDIEIKLVSKKDYYNFFKERDLAHRNPYGSYHEDLNEIWINKDLLIKDKYQRQRVEETLLHEVIHLIHQFTGKYTETIGEEHSVHLQTNLLYHILNQLEVKKKNNELNFKQNKVLDIGGHKVKIINAKSDEKPKDYDDGETDKFI